MYTAERCFKPWRTADWLIYLPSTCSNGKISDRLECSMQHVYSVFTSMVKVTMSKSILSNSCSRISMKVQCDGWYWISKMHVNTSYRNYSEAHMMQRYEEKTCKSMMMTLTLDVAFLLQAIGHRYARGSWVFGGIYDWIYGCWKVNWMELWCWSSLFMMDFFIDDEDHCGLLLESVASLDITALAHHVQMKSTSWWASTKDRALGKSFIYITQRPVRDPLASRQHIIMLTIPVIPL